MQKTAVEVHRAFSKGCPVFYLPEEILSLQKIFGSNLTLQKREAFGIGVNEWVSLANAKEKISKTDTCLIVEYSPTIKKNQ